MKKVAVLSLWRDSESYIERSLSQFDTAESELSDLQFVYGFLENDSKDDTAAILNSWIKTKIGFVISERVQAPKWGSVASLERVRYQARYRNMILDLLNNYYNYNYLLIADTDVYWQPSLIRNMINKLDQNPTWGMISPNTVQNVRDHVENTHRKSYFDSWALKDLDDNQCMTFAANPFLRKVDRELWDNKQPVSCNSAFGSIAMTKIGVMEGVEWDVVDGVEHWEFCKGIRDKGYEVIADPSLHAEIIHKKEVVPHPSVVQMHRDRLKNHLSVVQILPRS